jgi:putative tricarboxylic transport membrane protein
MFGAFLLHGVTPGPILLKQRPEMFWGIIASMYIGNIMLLVLNLPLIGLFVKITTLPSSIMGPIIVLVCLVGAYGVNNNPMDILVMVIFGVLGYLMRKFSYEPAPLVLAFVLGPMIEISLRQSLILSEGSFLIFFVRPIAGVLLGAAILMLLAPMMRKHAQGELGRTTAEEI